VARDGRKKEQAYIHNFSGKLLAEYQLKRPRNRRMIMREVVRMGGGWMIWY
jgi:hypothetical protein